MHPEHIEAVPSPVLLTADIGGTWIKLAAFDPEGDSPLAKMRVPNPSREGRPAAFADEVRAALRNLLDGRAAAGIGISTAGIVDYGGTRLMAGHSFLDPLKSPAFGDALRTEFDCPVTLINDGDAALIGAARARYFTGPGCHGLLVVGTGCGFALWKNGLRWRPDRQLPLLGALRTPDGTFDDLCSAPALAARTAENNLERVFSQAAYRPLLDDYLGRLALLVENAALTYHCESILLAGGLVAAAREAGFDLAAALGARLTPSTDYYRAPIVRCAREGNDLALAGVRALISGEAAIARHHVRPDFRRLPTEAPAGRPLRLETCSAEELVGLCLDNENRVAANWNRQAGAMAQCARRLSAALSDGGRLIYLGCGTSGRLAALDALELYCTFGLLRQQAVALISGGVAEAAASIEEDFEEDASSLPELLLLEPGPRDVVIGVSASGSAWFVRSGLAHARRCGAFSVMVSAQPPEVGICDLHIGLETGPELVTGSTRMKAGTATKKILNAVSTTAMILCGKVAGTHMIDVACLNEKLVERACSILGELRGLDRGQALDLLHRHDLKLSNALHATAPGPSPVPVGSLNCDDDLP